MLTAQGRAGSQPTWDTRIKESAAMVRIEAIFYVLKEDGPAAMLECPRCGCEFEVNAYSGENLIIDLKQMRQLAVCPLCATVEKTGSAPRAIPGGTRNQTAV